jgi:hypothetical protein
MEYKLKSATAKNLPYTNKDGIFGIDIFIKVGIVNQTYSGFENLNMAFCPLEKTDDYIITETKINDFATRYVSEKYGTDAVNPKTK